MKRLAALALITSLCLPTAANAATLRWPAPTLVDPQTITLPKTGTVTLKLDNSQDYRIVYPTVRRSGGLRIVGGHDIVIQGGASTIPSWQSGRNLLIQDSAGSVPSRIVHIEGVDIDASGGGESDGIDIAAPTAIIQLEYDRVTGLIGHLSATHADVVQSFGGFQELRVYMMTGASHYNNLYLRRENNPLGPPIGKVTLDHVNMFGYTNPAGWDVKATLRAIAIGTQPWDSPANSASATNCELTSPVVLHDFYASPPSGVPLERWMYPTDYMDHAGCPSALKWRDAAYWPALASMVSGVIHRGLPDGGDYVPTGSVGVGYEP